MSETAVDTPKDRKKSVGEFIRETREELDKTTFPSSDDVRKTVLIVIINVIFFTVYLFVIDYAWTYILGDKNHNTGLTWLVNKLFGY